MKTNVKTAYLPRPIEFKLNLEFALLNQIEAMLQKRGVICINPIRVSHKVGDDILHNQVYAATLKREWRLKEFNEFMDGIWRINKESVDRSDIIVTAAETPAELEAVSGSGGTKREVERGINQRKPCLLVCGCDSLEVINSHLLHSFTERGLEYGWAFKSIEQMVGWFNTYAQLPDEMPLNF